MWYVAALLLIFASIIVAKARSRRRNMRLAAARDAYQRDEFKLGRTSARRKCGHEFMQFGQTGIPGIATMTTKWCRVCGQNLGPAKLKKSFFGNRWESPAVEPTVRVSAAGLWLRYCCSIWGLSANAPDAPRGPGGTSRGAARR